MQSDSDRENMNTVNSQQSAISFSAIKGKQGLGDCYLVFIPFSMLATLPVMKYPDDCPAEEKAQRSLNKAHAKGLCEYLVKDSDNFMLPALTASVVKNPDFSDDLGMEFIPAPSEGFENSGIITLHPGSMLLFNDGQHRLEGALRAASQEASLGDKTLPVLLLPDYDLAVSQQLFYLFHAKQKAVSTSLQVAYNTLEVESNFTNDLTRQTPILKAFTDREKTSLSGKNSNLFTLSLLRKLTIKMRNDSTRNHQQSLEFCSKFFKVLTEAIPHWSEALQKTTNASEIRECYVSTQAVTLEALAELACEIRDKYKLEELEGLFNPFKNIEWEKTNPDWEGRILNRSFKEGKLVYKMFSKKDNIIRMRLYLKVILGLRISSQEYELEKLSRTEFFRTLPLDCLPEVSQLEISDFLAQNQATTATAETLTLAEEPVLVKVDEQPTDTEEVLPTADGEQPPSTATETLTLAEEPVLVKVDEQPTDTEEVLPTADGEQPPSTAIETLTLPEQPAIRRRARKKPNAETKPNAEVKPPKTKQAGSKTKATNIKKPKAASDTDNTEEKVAVSTSS